MKRILSVSVVLAFLMLIWRGNLFGQYHSLAAGIMTGIKPVFYPRMDQCLGGELTYEFRFSPRHGVGVKGIVIDPGLRERSRSNSLLPGSDYDINYSYRYGSGIGIGAFYRYYFKEGQYFETALSMILIREQFSAFRSANAFYEIPQINLETGSNFPGIKADFLWGFNSYGMGFYTQWNFGLSYFKQFPSFRPYLVASTSQYSNYAFLPSDRGYLMFTTSLAFGGRW